MRQHAIESHPAVLIRIKSLVEKVAQEAAVLRDAFAIHALRRSHRIGRMLGVGREVANGGEASAGHNRIGNDIDVLVNPAGLKAAIEMNVSIAGRELAVHHVRELPLSAWNHGTLGVARITNSKHIARIVRRGDRVFRPADVALDQVSQRNLRHRLVWHKIAAKQARDGLALILSPPAQRNGARPCRRHPIAIPG